MFSQIRNKQLIAILRGVCPTKVLDVAAVLVEAGIHIIEVPLNSPEPLISIAKLANAYGENIMIGAGTVLNTNSVDAVHRAGGKLIVSPNVDKAVIKRTKELAMVSAPGFATPTEGFAAIDAGADILKMFPAGSFGASYLSAIKAVLPNNKPVYAVGGVGPAEMQDFVTAGASGFGLGSNLFQPSLTLKDIRSRAVHAVAASHAAFSER